MKWIYYSNGNRHVDIIMEELFHSDYVLVLDGRKKPVKNIILKAIQKLHLSHKINKVINLPMKRIWLNSKIPLMDDGEAYTFLFTDNIPWSLDYSYLRKLRAKSKGRIKYVLFLLNPIELFKDTTMYNLNHMDFDLVLTCDFTDSGKYGFPYMEIPYSVLDSVKQNNDVDTDLYLICWSKGRLPLIHSVYSDAKKNNVIANFRVTGVEPEDQVYDDISYNNRISYDEALIETSHANCILDMLPPGEDVITTRYYEAVCYNKKLLTSNKRVMEQPFYNPAYMHIFERPEDIDWDWVKERSHVDYHYDGRYSPLAMLKKIEKQFL